MSLEVKTIEGHDWVGVRLSSRQGDLYRTIAVVKNADDNYVAATAFTPVDDATLLEAYALDDASTTQPWIWSLLNGKIDTHVLNQMGAVIGQGEVSDDQADVVQRGTATFDHEAVALMTSSAEPKLSYLHFYVGDDERALNRKRHGQIYPILSDVMAAKLQVKRVIDTKTGSLPEALCKTLSSSEFEVTPAYLKRFAKMKAFPEGCDRASMLVFSAHVPPDWLPSTDEEWTAFCQIATAVIGELMPPNDQIRTMVKSSSGKWIALRDKVVSAAFPSDRNNGEAVALLPGSVATNEDVERQKISTAFSQLKTSMRSARDMVSAFCDNVVLPMIAYNSETNKVFLNEDLYKKAYEISFKVLTENRTIADIADLARRFEQEQYNILEGGPNLQEQRRQFIVHQVDGDWPALSPRRQAPNHLWIVPLTSIEQLEDESRQLAHCVGRGGYNVAAERCDTHIVSVKKEIENGKLASVSTVEIPGISGPNGPFSVRQHQGHSNTEPGSEARAAVAWYLDSLKAGLIETNWEQIKAFKTVENRDIDGVERICRFDWREPEYLFASVVPWHPFMVKSFKNMTFEELVSLPDIKAACEHIAPEMLSAYSAA